ncbi:MAG: peroxiredoxin-like family protein [Candidatus Izemoplasmatales bacterium]|nr:peroxiredoxin-like family protein [Candidatus Izemoplasmatales bacterium]
MTYKKYVEKMKEKSTNSAPEEIVKIFRQAAKELKDKNLEDQALKVGDKLPSFSLKNAYGEMVHIEDILKEGPIIINFYRGSWCPYCNLELRLYQKLLPKIKELGANIIAISPDLEKYSFTMQERNQFGFEVLSDINHEVSKQFGLVFTVDQKLIPIYQKMGIDLSKYQGNTAFELPFPATYVVNQEGIITLAFVDSAYELRLEPTKALDALKKIKGVKDDSSH